MEYVVSVLQSHQLMTEEHFGQSLMPLIGVVSSYPSSKWRGDELITVYYDGICSLCSREIAHYKKIAPPNIIRWVDVNKDISELSNYGISQIDALKYLHVIDQTGQIRIGADAFELIWSLLPRWKFLSIIIRVPIVKYFAKYVYTIFVNKRFSKAEHCQILLKSD